MAVLLASLAVIVAPPAARVRMRRAWAQKCFEASTRRRAEPKNPYVKRPKRDRSVGLIRERERKFVVGYVARVRHALPELFAARSPATVNLSSTIGALLWGMAYQSYCSSGYRKLGKGGANPPKKVDQLLQLPRIQQAIAKEFDAQGLSRADCGRIMSEIANGSIRTKRQVLGKDSEVVTLEEDVPIDARLRAVELVFKLTTGYATNKHAVAIASDTFFNEAEFNEVPPIDVTPKTVDDKS